MISLGRFILHAAAGDRVVSKIEFYRKIAVARNLVELISA